MRIFKSKMAWLIGIAVLVVVGVAIWQSVSDSRRQAALREEVNATAPAAPTPGASLDPITRGAERFVEPDSGYPVDRGASVGSSITGSDVSSAITTALASRGTTARVSIAQRVATPTDYRYIPDDVEGSWWRTTITRTLNGVEYESASNWYVLADPQNATELGAPTFTVFASAERREASE